MSKPDPSHATLNRFRVLLVDDHHMMRLGLKALAQSSSKVPIDWFESSNLDDALAMYGACAGVDLVLLDLNLPDSKGLQGLRRFLGAFAEARVAVFSATEDEFVVGQALAMGAAGFVPKSAMPDATLRLVESLLGGFQIPESSVQEQDCTSAQSLHARAAMLNPTQHKVLELLLAGMSNQEIATECKLALGTVKNTVSGILLSLDVRSRSHLLSVFK
jgi:DNA-binding NarL/FixJ family response regulator